MNGARRWPGCPTRGVNGPPDRSRRLSSRPWRGPSTRRGFSLLETLLATAILLGAVAVLGELVRQGLRSASAARDLTRAQTLAESLLNEIAIGADEGRPSEKGVFLHEPHWEYTLTRSAASQPGLVELRLQVRLDRPHTVRPVRFELVRWVRGEVDPRLTPGTEQPLGQPAGPRGGGGSPAGPGAAP